MKTKFNYNIEDRNLLLEITFNNLKYKIDELPIYKNGIESDKDNFEAYLEHIKKEISIFEEINFDGYMLLLHNMVNTSREMNIFINCFGSIQYSLVAYILEITEHYNFKEFREFLNFTAFEKKPMINVVATSSRIGGVVSYLDTKYKNLIKELDYDGSIVFNDNLTIKFIDLNVDNEVRLSKKDVENLGLEIVEPNVNTSEIKAIISQDNKLFLGLESLEIGDSLVYMIIEERENEDFGLFENFDDLYKRVPLLEYLDAKKIKLLSTNNAFSLSWKKR